MSTATLATQTTGANTVPVATRAQRVLASEWVKLRSVRSTRWTLLATVVVTIGLGALFAHGVAGDWSHRPAAEKATFDPTAVSLAGLYLSQLIVGALGVLVMTAEWSTGTVAVTFAATPRRGGVLAGKAVVLAAVTFVVSLVMSFAAFGIAQALLHGAHIGVSLGQPHVLRAVVGGALYLTAVALLGLGCGTLLRNTAAGISTVVGLLFVLPILGHFLPQHLADHVNKYLPANAGFSLVSVVHDPTSLAPWAGYAVFCLYAAIALALGTARLLRRDA